MSAEEDILKGFVGILEDHFPEASTFLPRDVELGKFLYVNDGGLLDRREKEFREVLKRRAKQAEVGQKTLINE